MPILRCQITLPYFTNNPDDVATNTWHFFWDGVVPAATAASDITDGLQTMYQSIFSTTLLSPIVNRSICTAKWFNLADPEPRAPVAVFPFMPATAAGSAGAVEEFAVCLSYQAPILSGSPQARRRGRIYFGPWASTAITAGTTTAFSQVSSTVRTAMANAAEAFITYLEADEGLQWVVWSPTTLTSSVVQNGWIDVRPDTQRRRGSRLGTRTLWAYEP